MSSFFQINCFEESELKTNRLACFDRIWGFQEFVHKKKLYANYDKTYLDLKRRGETYKRIDPKGTDRHESAMIPEDFTAGVFAEFLLCQTGRVAFFPDKPVAESVNKYLDEVNAKWQPMKVEIGSVQTMLEKTIEYWKRYHACVDIFIVWLTDAERVLDKPPEERGVSAH